MGLTKINVSEVVGLSPDIGSAKGLVGNARDTFGSAWSGIDGRILGRRDINNRLSRIRSKMSTLESSISSIKSMVENGAQKYQTTDWELSALAKSQNSDAGFAGGNNWGAFNITGPVVGAALSGVHNGDIGAAILGASIAGLAGMVGSMESDDTVETPDSLGDVTYSSGRAEINEAEDEKQDVLKWGGAVLSTACGFSLLGYEFEDEIGKIFGEGSLSGYLAGLKTENTEHYLGKVTLSEEDSFKSGEYKSKKLDDFIDDYLEDSEKRFEAEDTFFLDKDGNEISEKDAPTFYKKEVALAEAGKKVGVSASIYEGKISTGEDSSVDIVVGNAEAHASMVAGFYVLDAEGKKKFSPGVNAEVGVSVTALEVDWEQQWLGNKDIGLNTEVKATVGKAEATAELGMQLYGEDGKLDVQFGASAKAEAIAAEVEGSVGVNVLGGEVELGGSVNFGVGAHADIGYKDGVFKCDVGASLGIGVSVDIELDVGGMVDTVCDAASSAVDAVKDGWNSFKSGWNAFWD